MDSNRVGWFEDICRDARAHIEGGRDVQSLVESLKSKGAGMLPIAQAIRSVNGKDMNSVLKDVRKFFREESGRY